MSFVDDQDQLMQDVIEQLQDLNHRASPVLMARNATIASGGNVDDAVMLLQRNAIRIPDLSQEAKWSMMIGAGKSATLHYTSHHQIRALVQFTLVTLPISLVHL